MQWSDTKRGGKFKSLNDGWKGDEIDISWCMTSQAESTRGRE